MYEASFAYTFEKVICIAVYAGVGCRSDLDQPLLHRRVACFLPYVQLAFQRCRDAIRYAAKFAAWNYVKALSEQLDV